MGTAPIASPSRRAKLSSARTALPTDLSAAGIAAFAAAQGVTVAAIKARLKRHADEAPTSTAPAHPDHTQVPAPAIGDVSASAIVARLSDSSAPATAEAPVQARKRPGRRPKAATVESTTARPAEAVAPSKEASAARATPVVSVKDAVRMLKNTASRLSVVITDLDSGAVMLVSSGADA